MWRYSLLSMTVSAHPRKRKEDERKLKTMHKSPSTSGRKTASTAVGAGAGGAGGGGGAGGSGTSTPRYHHEPKTATAAGAAGHRSSSRSNSTSTAVAMMPPAQNAAPPPEPKGFVKKIVSDIDDDEALRQLQQMKKVNPLFAELDEKVCLTANNKTVKTHFIAASLDYVATSGRKEQYIRHSRIAFCS